MTYTRRNYRFKKDLLAAVSQGIQVEVYEPSGYPVRENVTLEGPHYPAPHTWYAEAVVKDGIIVSVK